ncbi:MAG TPA: DUF3276 family protein [candidate division Zixibacteria bacterium]|nr:DUF3276 family protein [candidate division Zixibacteria bacterium]
MFENERYKGRAGGGKRTYFFDVKESSEGKLYLEISERVKKGDEYEKHSILVFDDVLLEFVTELKKAAKFITDSIVSD